MSKKEINRHIALNELAECGGIVIFGGTEDRDIPICELKQAFEFDSKLYNRSVTDLSVNNACEIYDACISQINPENILLHIGAADLKLFDENAADFDQKCRELISHIKLTNKKCTITVISLKNPENNGLITEMNKHLKYIAEAEQCEFEDITNKRVWNPKQTKEVVSFIYSIGFVRPLKKQRPIYDLIKILFCYEYANTDNSETAVYC